MGASATVGFSGASRVARRLSPPDALQWRVVALAVGGGMLGIAGAYGFCTALGVLDPVGPGYEVYADKYLWLRWFHRAFALCGLLGAVVGSVGLSAVGLLVAGRWHALVATVGCVSAAAASAVLLLVWAYDTAAYPFGLDEGLRVRLLSASVVVCYGGFLLVGVAALGVRGLGRSRVLPLGLGACGVAYAAVPLALLISPPAYSGTFEGWPLTTITFSSPAWRTLTGLGWLLLARPLLRAPARERALVEAQNLVLARRLYEGAWVGGDPAVVDETSAPDLADHYGNGCGPESLKRSILGLRQSFPDLRFAVEAQEAAGDEVTTRWTASGTDRGGVLWYPPTGRRAEFSGTFVDRFEDGRLVEHRGEYDRDGLLRQLGLPRA